MALSVKLSDCTVSLPENVGKGIPSVQAIVTTDLQTITRWRSQRMGSWCSNPVQNQKLRCGRLVPQVTRTRPFKPAALPLDRSGLKNVDQTESDESEPWLGSVIFKRSAVRTHYEFETSLERLGMGFLSTEASRTVANSMGLTYSGSEPSAAEETPVMISIDVSKEGERKKDLRLEGIARTTMSLCCNRCLAPVVERIFADFSLLLTEELVSEPTQQRIGVVLGNSGRENDESQLDIDLDDKLHFPKEEKEMDLSKYFRDTVHLEIPAKSLCSLHCLGLCTTCGVNLNKRRCNCLEGEVKQSWGPLEQLKMQLEEDEGDQEDNVL